jgi:LysR family transcriptional regulator AphB
VEFVLDDAKTDLIAESIDVAIRSGRLLEHQSLGSRLIQTHSILVASPSYLAAHGWPSNPESLAEHECLPLARGSGRVNWRLDGPAGLTEVTVSGRFRANTARAVVQAAVAGLGVALIPYPLSTPEIEAGHLVRVLPEHRQEGASLYAVILNRRQVARAVAAFVDFISEKLRLDGASWKAA